MGPYRPPAASVEVRRARKARARRRQLARAPVDDADGTAEGAFDGRPGHQRARADLARERGGGQERDAEPGLDRALDRLDVVELHGVADAHAVAAQEPVDHPARGDVALEADEGLTVERGEGAADAPRDAMAGRRRDDQLVVAEGHDLELGPARRHRHDAEVDVAGETRRVHLVGAPVGELHADARMSGQAPLDRRRQRVQAHAVDGRHAHRSRHDVRPCAQRAARAPSTDRGTA